MLLFQLCHPGGIGRAIVSFSSSHGNCARRTNSLALGFKEIMAASGVCWRVLVVKMDTYHRLSGGDWLVCNASLKVIEQIMRYSFTGYSSHGSS